jgi:hypothetical protein
MASTNLMTRSAKVLVRTFSSSEVMIGDFSRLSIVPAKRDQSKIGNYSYRSATMGSTLAARRAGM